MRNRPQPGRRALQGQLLFFVAGICALQVVAREPLSGQSSPGTGCDVPHFDRLTNLALSNGSRVTFFSAPIIVCAEGTRISADSAVVYEATSYTQLFRNVVFQDRESRLTADRANYFNEENRLRAWGSVILRDLAEGSIIRGDTMVLLRAGAQREEDRLTVTGRRPAATLYPTRQPVDTAGAVGDSIAGGPAVGDSIQMEVPEPDSLSPPPLRPTREEGPPAPEMDRREPPSSDEPRIPWEVEAQRIVLEGSSIFRATGDVDIQRDSVDAVAESMEYDGDAGTLLLARGARLTTAEFDLSARDIRLEIPQDEIRGIDARHEALLEGEDLKLLAPTILMFLTEGELDQLVAARDPALDSLPEEVLAERPPHGGALNLGFPQFPLQPHAFAQDFLLWGDSIEVAAPGGKVEEVKAMGQARGESLARDTLNTEATPELIRRDWLEGDTITAYFAQVGEESQTDAPVAASPEVPPPAGGRRQEAEVPDSSTYRLERLVAIGNARSLYRMAPSDSTIAEEENRLAIHYVVGQQITILMDQGEVDRMEVAGTTRGIHLEPVRPARRGGGPVPDTARVSGPPGGGRQ